MRARNARVRRGQGGGDRLVGVDGGKAIRGETDASGPRLRLVGSSALGRCNRISQSGTFLRRSFDRWGRVPPVSLYKMHAPKVSVTASAAHPENYGRLLRSLGSVP